MFFGSFFRIHSPDYCCIFRLLFFSYINFTAIRSLNLTNASYCFIDSMSTHTYQIFNNLFILWFIGAHWFVEEYFLWFLRLVAFIFNWYVFFPLYVLMICLLMKEKALGLLTMGGEKRLEKGLYGNVLKSPGSDKVSRGECWFILVY